MTNPGVVIVFSWLVGVELHSLIFSDHFDNCKRPLLKALFFLPVSKFDYRLLIFCHYLHLLYVHFREYEIQGAFVSLCSTIIIASLLEQTITTRLHDDIHTCHSDYSRGNTYQIHHPIWLTSHVWEFGKKTGLVMIIFELRDFPVAHVCNFSRLALQESLS